MKQRVPIYKLLLNPFPYICFFEAFLSIAKNIIYISQSDSYFDLVLLWGTVSSIIYIALGTIFAKKNKIILFMFYILETCCRIFVSTSYYHTSLNYEILLISFFSVFYLFSTDIKVYKVPYFFSILLIVLTMFHSFSVKTVYFLPLSAMSDNMITFSKVESLSTIILTSVQLILISISSSLSLRKIRLKNEVTQKKLEYITCHDTLTGLMNRYLAFTYFSNCETRKTNEGLDYGIAILDIDDFKKINDLYGHDCGDFVLKSYTQELRKRLPHQNKISRWGGEEFVIIFPKITQETIFELDTIRELLSLTPFYYNGITIHVSATYGISSSRKLASANDILNDADAHLYIGKENGKNRLVVSENF
ncbi:MAG: GGDEF domain-containing protein [Treponema sp.]|nr:GGDEF domain-containing protein [Candidatus Treponema merdequi]